MCYLYYKEVLYDVDDNNFLYKKEYYKRIISLSKTYIRHILYGTETKIFSIICITIFFINLVLYKYRDEKIEFIYKELFLERYYDVKNINNELYDVSIIYVNGLYKCIIKSGIHNKTNISYTNSIWLYSNCDTIFPEIFLIILLSIIFFIFFIFLVISMYDVYMLYRNIKNADKKLKILNDIV